MRRELGPEREDTAFLAHRPVPAALRPDRFHQHRARDHADHGLAGFARVMEVGIVAADDGDGHADRRQLLGREPRPLLTARVDFINFDVPVAQIVIFAIAAIIVGIVAAILPARRAAKLNVLQALQYE